MAKRLGLYNISVIKIIYILPLIMELQKISKKRRKVCTHKDTSYSLKINIDIQQFFKR